MLEKCNGTRGFVNLFKNNADYEGCGFIKRGSPYVERTYPCFYVWCYVTEYVLQFTGTVTNETVFKYKNMFDFVCA